MKTNLAVALVMITTSLFSQTGEVIIAASKESNLPSNPFFSPDNIAGFEAEHPGVKIKFNLIPDAQTKITFQAMLASSTPPDIIVYSKVSAENELDAVKTMTDLSTQPWVGRLQRPELLRSPNGAIYIFQRAIDENGIGMVYDKAIFRRLGLAIPRTYTELLKTCDRLKSAGLIPLFGPFKDTWTFQIWPTVAFGTLGSKLKPDLWSQINSGGLRWTQVPEFRRVLERGKELVDRGYFQPAPLTADYAAAQKAFQEGKVAMMFMGQWFLQDMAEKAPGREFDIFPLPVWDEPQNNVIGQGQIGGALVPLKAKNKTLALAYLDFLARPEVIRRDLQNPVTVYTPNFKDITVPVRHNSLLAALYENYIRPGLVSTEMNAYLKVDVSESWLYYQDMIAGNKTPSQVLEFWDRKFRLLMKQKGISGF